MTPASQVDAINYDALFKQAESSAHAKSNFTNLVEIDGSYQILCCECWLVCKKSC